MVMVLDRLTVLLFLLPFISEAVRIVPKSSNPTSSYSSSSNSRSIQQQQEAEDRRKLLFTNHSSTNSSSSYYSRHTSSSSSSGSTKVKVEIPSTPDAHLIESLPLLDPKLFPTQQWAGHLPADASGDKYFFYWLFEPDMNNGGQKRSLDTIPLIIWLNGGPACSSMDGLFLENGPFRLVLDTENNNSTTGTSKSQYKVVPDPYSWHKLPAYTLYIDQPVGTGFSFTNSHKYATNDEELCIDFYYFLQQFFNFHADKFVTTTTIKTNADDTDTTTVIRTVNRPFYFSGESYAGHYNSIYVNYILKQNSLPKKKKSWINIPVSGAAIGNGWVDPFHQYSGAEAAYGFGIIDLAQVTAFKQKEIQCQKQLLKGHYSVPVCFSLIDEIIYQSQGKNSKYIISGYDVRRVEERNGERTFPPGHKVLESYLGNWPIPSNDPGTLPHDIANRFVIPAIHATAATQSGLRFQECTDPPFNVLADKDGQGVVSDLVQILEHPDNVQLLFFNGIMDMICHHVGTEITLQNLPWKYQFNWTQADRYAWMMNPQSDKVHGYMKEYNNLHYLKVMDSGHMVPLDQPLVAFEMMKNFVYKGSFDTSQQDLDVATTSDNACPICPECSFESTTSDPSNQPQRQKWIMGSVIVILLLIAFVTIASCQQRHGSRSPMYIESLSQDDLEMSEARYKDEPISNGNGA